MRRSLVAGTLWPEASDARAGACLRSAIARLGDSRGHMLIVNATDLALDAVAAVQSMDVRRRMGIGLHLKSQRQGRPPSTGGGLSYVNQYRVSASSPVAMR
jgi:hypothetical protein